MKNIFLIGFMGTGKSTVAFYLKTVCKMTIIEMDQVIEEQDGCSIGEIFEKYGEAYFRDKESELLTELGKKENMVVSCGGGIVLRKRNVLEMKKSGKVVLLTARPDTILMRVQEDTSRPLLQKKKTLEYITQMMEERRGKYEQAADIIVETDGKTIKEICEDILERIGE